jgi:negative regulator of flagellin synthesis FlgM
MTTSKIQGNPYGGPGQARSTDAGKAAGKTGAAGTFDVKGNAGVQPATPGKASQAAEVEMSQRAKSYQKALEIARATPDVREDKVAALKKQIQDGTYKINAGGIADGMAREAIMEHLAETEGR